MPYCKTVFRVLNPKDVEPLLSQFARENFVQGLAAYHIGNNRYSIDAGENDLRAIYDVELQLLRFFAVIQVTYRSMTVS